MGGGEEVRDAIQRWLRPTYVPGLVRKSRTRELIQKGGSQDMLELGVVVLLWAAVSLWLWLSIAKPMWRTFRARQEGGIIVDDSSPSEPTDDEQEAASPVSSPGRNGRHLHAD